jgi:hypothetical protein
MERETWFEAREARAVRHELRCEDGGEYGGQRRPGLQLEVLQEWPPRDELSVGSSA